MEIQSLNFQNISSDAFTLPLLTEKKIRASVLRLDKLHPIISGNKWFKLQFYIKDALQLNKKQLITFGGAWSNHIVATAAAANLHGLMSLGIIRGERPAILSQTLLDAESLGMKLHFISRSEYSDKQITEEVLSDYDYIIPEGGHGKLGAAGAATILDQISRSSGYTHICCAVGTGTMMSGLINAADKEEVIGINILKNNKAEESVKILLTDQHAPIHIRNEFHFGGYAKCNQQLIDFMNDLYTQTNIPTDFVYTAKLFFGVMEMVSHGYFPQNSNILVIHSGGLQGNRSLGKGTLIF